MECWAAQDVVTRFLYYFYGYIKISTHFFKPLPGYLWYPLLHLATIADHAGKRICISMRIQA